MKNIFFYHTYLGQIGIAEEDNKVTNVFFTNPENYYLKETDILKEASRQLYEYLQGKRQVFSIPLAPNGTEFMKRVWKSLCDIPYGETRSYKDIATDIGNEKACRAVGQANNRNPIPIFIPCHRVIGSNGNLIGYSSGLKIKKLLLQIENQYRNIN